MNKHLHNGSAATALGHDNHDNVIRGLFRPTMLSRGWAALKGWRNRRIAIRELNAMPDALLRDIGIERYQIKNAVNNFAKRPDVISMSGESRPDEGMSDEKQAAVHQVQKAA